MTIPPITVQSGTTNLITNPVAAADTSGWTLFANRTLARVTSLPASLPDELADSVTTGFSITAGTDFVGGATIQQTGNLTLTAKPHMASAYVYVPAAYGGSSLQLWASGFDGASGTTIGTVNLETRDQWQRVTVGPFTPSGSDLIGVIFLRQISGTWAIGEKLYCTAWMVSPGNAARPFVIGTAPDVRLPGLHIPGTIRIGPMHHS